MKPILESSQGSLHIRLSTESDIDRLTPNLRAEDLAEVLAATGETGHAALVHGLKYSSKCYTGLWQGSPIFMAGTVYQSSQVGHVWMLCADLSNRQSIAILRAAPEFIAKFHKQFPLLGSHVDTRNALHVRWLKAMGFFVGEPQPLGHEGQLFHSVCHLSQAYKDKLCAAQQHCSQQA